ncbi:bile acid:sodium symporter family protein [Emticicia sp. CRIBPO]|uniref:bile acid:sodium symporter family protein n=1 Tax=Emticicia sp. CRIBPO TaxID=2683258 RepID=UPI001412416F|nr:bile acid:sodium symporter family protein [Emticicia sp. CRIBPO]NBA84953.1 bile acid:sodium symporter family protein [Emticicia sp. CRIBPO]
MNSNILTQVFLPLALAFIMLGMGLTLVAADFKRVLLFPKAMTLGLFNHVFLLPAIAWTVIFLLDLKLELAVGLMILASCPAGPTSNLITHLSKGDTALAITLTIFSSLITVFTIPFVVNFAITYFMPDGKEQILPIFDTILSVLFITALPVALGMLIKSRFPSFAEKSGKTFKILSAAFLIIIIASTLVKEREHLKDFFVVSGPAALLLNILTLGIAYILSRLIRLSTKQSLTISIESGIQNGTLGIAIATTLLKNPTMSIPSAIYSIIMFITSIFIIMIGNRILK